MLKVVKKNNHIIGLKYSRDSKLQDLYETILKTDMDKRTEVFGPLVTESVSDLSNSFCHTEGIQFIVSDMDTLYEMVDPSIRQTKSFQFLLDLNMSLFRSQVKKHKEPFPHTAYVVLCDSEEAEKEYQDYLESVKNYSK